MNQALLVVLVAVAGGTGSVARFVVDAEVRRRLAGPYPWGTFVVNVSGCLLLGLLAGLATHAGQVYAVLGTGFCGGYTTFSTAVVEVVRLGEQRHRRTAAAYAVGSLLAGVAAATVGVLLTS